MMAESPLLPLVGVSIGLLGLIGILVVAVMKLRRAGREKRAAGANRLSEEAFAAATIKAALATPAAVPGAPAGAAGLRLPGPGPGSDGLDGAVLEATAGRHHRHGRGGRRAPLHGARP